MNLTVRESPPVASIHARVDISSKSWSDGVGIVVPLRSLPEAMFDSLRTTMPSLGSSATNSSAGATSSTGTPWLRALISGNKLPRATSSEPPISAAIAVEPEVNLTMSTFSPARVKMPLAWAQNSGVLSSLTFVPSRMVVRSPVWAAAGTAHAPSTPAAAPRAKSILFIRQRSHSRAEG